MGLEQPPMSFDEWLQYGIAQGWASKTVCSTHDGLPFTDEEEEQWEQGLDPCVHAIRLFETKEDQENVSSRESRSDTE